MSNPYQAPQAQTFSSPILPQTYGGIGRLAYFLILIGAYFANRFINIALLVAESTVAFLGMIFVFLGFAAVGIIATFHRFKNIGMNPWWCFLFAIPLINLIVVVRGMICQEGYSDTRKLDTAGKILTFLALGFFLLIVGLLFLNVGSG